MNRRALLISLVVAVMGITVFAGYLSRYEEEVSGGELVQLLTALKPIPMGAIVTDDMLATRGVPRAYVENRAILARDRDKILGLRMGQSLRAQQTLLWTDLSIAMSQRRSLSALIQPGMRAFMIHATSRNDEGYVNIHPGDRIDVMTTLTGSSPREEPSSVVLLQNVLVLSVGTDVSDSAPQRSTDLLLSLSVTIQEAQLLALATDKGKLNVALRNPDDVRVTDGLVDMTASALADGQTRNNAQRGHRGNPVRIEEN